MLRRRNCKGPKTRFRGSRGLTQDSGLRPQAQSHVACSADRDRQLLATADNKVDSGENRDSHTGILTSARGAFIPRDLRPTWSPSRSSRLPERQGPPRSRTIEVRRLRLRLGSSSRLTRRKLLLQLFDRLDWI